MPIKEEIQQLSIQGCSSRRIADYLGISVTKVEEVLLEYALRGE